MRSLSKILLILALTTAGCGGSDDSPPGPLASHFEMKHIVQIDVAQQTGAMDAQRSWNVAQAEEGKAKADYDDMANKLTAARICDQKLPESTPMICTPTSCAP